MVPGTTSDLRTQVQVRPDRSLPHQGSAQASWLRAKFQNWGAELGLHRGLDKPNTKTGISSLLHFRQTGFFVLL